MTGSILGIEMLHTSPVCLEALLSLHRILINAIDSKYDNRIMIFISV